MTPPTDMTPRSPRPRVARWLAGAGVVVVLGTGAVLYGMQGAGKEGPAACAGTLARGARLAPLVRGEVAALSLDRPPRLLSAAVFQDKDGTPRTLADFRGRTVLLNLWATWCVPCRKEMPALDRLQAQQGSKDFAVVAVNVDTAKLDRPRQFLADANITALPFYADPAGTLFPTLRRDAGVMGLPTTFLIDKNGCTLGTVAGSAEWDSPEAQALIAAAGAS